MRKLVLLSCIFCSGAASATSIKDFWQSRPADAPSYRTAKSAGSLELCLGMALSEKVGVPVVLHGERQTVITAMSAGFAPIPLGGVRIVDNGDGRVVTVGALQAGGWTNKIGAVAQSCL